MKKNLTVSIFSFLTLAAAGMPAGAEVAIPPQPQSVDQYIMDAGDLIKPGDETAMRPLIEKLAAGDRGHVVVYTIPAESGAMNADDLKAYANRVLEQWSLGRKEKGNGVLVVVNTRNVKEKAEHGRIYVATEPKAQDRLPDNTLDKVLQEVAVPQLNEEKPSDALRDTTLILSGLMLEDSELKKLYEDSDGGWWNIGVFLLFGGALLWGLFGRKNNGQNDDGDDWDVDTGSGSDGSGD